MQRFFTSNKNISAGHVIITDSRVHQIRDVLRMKTGDEIIVLDNTGIEYLASLTNISQKEVMAEIIQQKQCESEPRTKITLYQSLLAREKLEFVFQKCTEVGVASFVPVITERSIVRKPEKITKEKLSRFETIIAEAAEQSGRGIIPSLRSPITMDQAMSELNDYDICLVGSCVEGVPPLFNYFAGAAPWVSLREMPATQIALFIGPEGGFSEKELANLSGGGVKPFSLGKRILRTETAAVVAPAIILYQLE